MKQASRYQSMNHMNDQQIPTPPIKTRLFLPTEFWTRLLAILDAKVQNLSEREGQGKIEMRLIMQNGKLTNIYFNDEVVVKELVELTKK